ncbi:MAG: DUF2459 domain-containing protein [Rhodocyclaceae bacterium]|nr:DUF2459 domain-containing protein [Rhodocyclaceae bacterium]MCL4759882.1 DUF2459 domain-containing protein [Rhodocyclaceae bacterium]
MKSIVLLVVVLLCACASVRDDLVPAAPGEAVQRMYVVSNGFHSGIVLARADLPGHLLPETADFPHAAYFEFGWGDHIYYPMQEPPFWHALRAALLPTAAVLHVVPHTGAPRPGPGFEVIELSVSTAGLQAMIERIDRALSRGSAPRAASVARGPDAHSLFYPAHGSFHLFNTCNTWTARKLAAAGVPIAPAGVLTAPELMRRVRAAGARP